MVVSTRSMAKESMPTNAGKMVLDLVPMATASMTLVLRVSSSKKPRWIVNGFASTELIAKPKFVVKNCELKTTC